MPWKEEFAQSICTFPQLRDALGIPESEREVFERIISRFPMLITPYYLSLIDPQAPDDPIARMCIPSADELDPAGDFDTSGEQSNTRLEGVQHKYCQTALILSANICPVYCRHCFRKRLVGLSDEELNKQADEAIEYIRAHPEITNVLISGGDALMNPNRIIERYLEELCTIDSLDLIRFGSRVPVTFPQRITKDKPLQAIFERYAEKKAISLVTQFNHPREFTEEAVRAIQALRARGVLIRNQTVLLRGVNDNHAVLGSLLRLLTTHQIAPYYVFQCRPVTGVKKRFQVPLLEGAKIVDAAKAMQNGIGKSFRFAMSHPRGKIEILGTLADGEMLFKFHQSKSPDDSSKIFCVPLSAEDTWLDENLQGI